MNHKDFRPLPRTIYDRSGTNSDQEMKTEMDKKSKSKVSFSLELSSRNHIKRIALPDGNGDRLIIEGNLGPLTNLVMEEDILLEIIGDSGNMRIDITKKELEMFLNKKNTRVASKREN